MICVYLGGYVSAYHYLDSKWSPEEAVQTGVYTELKEHGR